MMFLILLAAIATILTKTMFSSREMLLGFPCGIFWALAGGQAYELFETEWDMMYITFFACMGMTIFTIYAAFTVNRRDLNPRESDWIDSEPFYDEGKRRKQTEKFDTRIDDNFKEYDQFHPNEKIKISGRRQDIRDRADKRRGDF